MAEGALFSSFFLIFTGAAIIATLALFGRQPLLIGYIVLGALLGPYGLAQITDLQLITDIATVGIIFLLFLLGLDMQPKALVAVMKQATHTALISAALFAAVGYGIGVAFGYGQLESLIIGLAMMFSSTIIGIKLLPTTVLHHKHTGELVVGLLLLQDFLAILVLLWLASGDIATLGITPLLQSLAALPVLVAVTFLAVRYVILPLISRFDRYHEYIFLLTIGWCLGISELAEWMGLSLEIGAFIAGISLATTPIAPFIAMNLKPLRDFFLILFFFALGARFNLELLTEVALAASVLALAMLVIKPVAFRFLLQRQSESKELAWDIGLRLGQISEFSLLVAFVAEAGGMISERASLLVQATAILTFLVSTYLVIFKLPNPLAVSDRLRRD